MVEGGYASLNHRKLSLKASCPQLTAGLHSVFILLFYFFIYIHTIFDIFLSNILYSPGLLFDRLHKTKYLLQNYII